MLQALVVLGLSSLALLWLGMTYVFIGLAVTTLALSLLLSRWRDVTITQTDYESLSEEAREFFFRLILAMMLGAIWPSLPVIIFGPSKRGTSDGSSH